MRIAWAGLGARPRLVVALVTCAAYLTGLSGPFQFDDHDVIVRYEPVHSLSAWWAGLSHGIRPLLKLSYALNWVLGAGAVGFHVFNVLVHVLNTDLVMRLFTAANDRQQRWPFAPRGRGAFAAGALFALHPLQTEAVTYISGRSSSLMACFVLGALLFYVQGVRAPRSWPWLAIALIAMGCAVLTKEIAAALPASLLLWEACFERPRWRALIARQALFSGLLVGLLAAAVMNASYYKLIYNALGVRPLPAALGHQIEGAAYLLSRMVLVHRLSIDPGLGLEPPSRVLVASAGALLLLLAGVAIHQRRSRPVVSFGIGWFFLQAFLPYLIVQRVDVLNERHLYLANFGVFAAVGALFSELSTRSRHVDRWQFTALAIGAALALATAARNLDYRSRRALWESTVRVSPANPRAHNNLGVALELGGERARAHAAYARALTLQPGYAAARRNLERLQLQESR